MEYRSVYDSPVRIQLLRVFYMCKITLIIKLKNLEKLIFLFVHGGSCVAESGIA